MRWRWSAPTASPTPSLGIVKVLAIPMMYADQNTIPSTEAALSATLRDVGDFYAKASFGRLTLVGNVYRAGPDTAPGLPLFVLGGAGDVASGRSEAAAAGGAKNVCGALKHAIH